MSAALRVGLTGGMAAGKSTVGRLLAEAGIRVVDADRVVAELYQPGGAGTQVVRELFGNEVLDPAGAVDRPKVAARVFADDGARSALEQRIHPLVRQHFAHLAETVSGPLVLEATLLVEAGYGPDFDLIVTVEASPAVRLARAIARGLDEPAARARLAAQGDGEARRQAAHRVIWNDGTAAELEEKVAELAREVRALAGVR